MRKFNVLNFFKWMTVWTATWTMLISPVAMGQEAQKVSKQQMQSVMDQLGLNKQITLGEFYKKNKYLFPPRIQKEIEPLFTQFKNQLMPTFEVISSKTTSGEEIPTIRISQDSELLNIQWFGEPERMLKFQNTNLSEIDVINFDDMFTRILAGDEKYRKQVEQNSAKAKPKSTTGMKYPDVTKAEWKSMSTFDRANYVINLRSLWQDAHKVLESKNSQKKAPKSSQNFFEKNNYFFSLIFGTDAEAANATGGKTVATGQTTGNYFSGQSCIVAGYVARYQKTSSGEVCDHKVVDQVYNNRDNSLYQKARDYCVAKDNQIACNPYVYGTPKGAPTCVMPSISNASFQKATHWDGPCDTSSRLQSSTNEVEILKDKNKAQGRYEDGNLKSEEERKAMFKAEQGDNLKLTEEYLLGILKFRGMVKTDANSLFDSGVLSDQVYEQIKKDKKAFDFEIAEAQKSCKVESEASKTAPRVHEKNYWQACDQLHRRFTFITELFQSKCDGKKLNAETLKCECDAPPAVAVTPAPAPVVAASPKPAPEAASVVPTPPPVSIFPIVKPEVVPGAVCSVVLPAVVPAAAVLQPEAVKPPVVAEDCESKYPGAGASGNKCVCADGKAPSKDITDVGTGQEAWSCGSASSKKDKKDDECGFICKIFNGIKKYAIPVLVTGVAVYAGYKLIKLLAPKKPALNPALDKCPDGSVPPCGQVCTPPLKKQTNGTCSCDGCPPGQTANATTCVCATGTTPGPAQTYLCPDSTTRVANLDNCPTYSCWNGQKYKNPMNCPPQIPATPSSSGTSH